MKNAGWYAHALVVLAVGFAPVSAAQAQPTVRLAPADRVLTGRPAPVFTVGRGADAFEEVAHVAFDADDNLYVLDRGKTRVSVYDRTGRLLRRIGSPGQGRGALAVPMQIAVTREGQVVVSDVAQDAFQVFGRDGTFRRSVPFDKEEGLPGVEMRPHPRNGVVTSVRPGGSRGGAAAPPRTSLTWVPLEPGARPSRLFQVSMAAPPPSSGGQDGAGAPGPQFRVSAPVVFAPKLHWGILPNGGFAVAHTARYSVRVGNANGSIARVIERPFTPRRVTARDQERARAELRASAKSGAGVMILPNGQRGSVPQTLIDQQLAGMRFAETVPVIERLTTDAAGRLWIMRSASETGGTGPIDVVTPDARYVGTLLQQAMPDAFSVGGRIAVVERTAEGASRVAVYALPASWR